MLNQKGIVVSTFAKLMLLYFMLAVVPVDFYHHHNLSTPLRIKGFSYSNNQHPERTVSLSSYCLICNVHFDKKYDLAQINFEINPLESVVFRFFNEIRFLFQMAILDITSRGPPLAL